MPSPQAIAELFEILTLKLQDPSLDEPLPLKTWYFYVELSLLSVCGTPSGAHPTRCAGEVSSSSVACPAFGRRDLALPNEPVVGPLRPALHHPAHAGTPLPASRPTFLDALSLRTHPLTRAAHLDACSPPTSSSVSSPVASTTMR